MKGEREAATRGCEGEVSPPDRGAPAGHIPSRGTASSDEGSQSEPWFRPGIGRGSKGLPGLLRGPSQGKQPQNFLW